MKRLDELSSLQKVASFATLVATYDKGEQLDISHIEDKVLMFLISSRVSVNPRAIRVGHGDCPKSNLPFDVRF